MTAVTVETLNPDGSMASAEQVELPGDQRYYDVSYSRLGNPTYTTLRDWAADAQAAYVDWPNKTAAQQSATMRETIRRLGILLDRMADQLLIQGRA